MRDLDGNRGNRPHALVVPCRRTRRCGCEPRGECSPSSISDGPLHSFGWAHRATSPSPGSPGSRRRTPTPWACSTSCRMSCQLTPEHRVGPVDLGPMGMRACSLLGVRAGRLRRGVRARVLPAEPREDGRAHPPSRRSRNGARGWAGDARRAGGTERECHCQRSASSATIGQRPHGDRITLPRFAARGARSDDRGKECPASRGPPRDCRRGWPTAGACRAATSRGSSWPRRPRPRSSRRA